MTGGHALDEKTADAEVPRCVCTGPWSNDGCLHRAWPLPIGRRIRNVVTGRRRLQVGYRLTVYMEPRDVWVGVYVAPAAVFVCPLPLVVFRWRRGPRTEWGLLIQKVDSTEADFELSGLRSRPDAVASAGRCLTHPSMAGRTVTVVHRAARDQPWTVSQ